MVNEKDERTQFSSFPPKPNVVSCQCILHFWQYQLMGIFMKFLVLYSLPPTTPLPSSRRKTHYNFNTQYFSKYIIKTFYVKNNVHFLNFFWGYFCFKFIHMYTYIHTHTYILDLGARGVSGVQWRLILREEHKLNNFVLRFLEPISYARLWLTGVFCACAKVLPAF